MIKLCMDEYGYMFATLVPEDECSNGPILGPPEGIRKDVHNALAKAGIYNAFDLIGQRKVVLDILRKLNIDRRYAATVTHIYQAQYFSEKEDE